MSDLSEQSCALLIPTAHKNVPMLYTGTSAISITMDPLGPCISYLMYSKTSISEHLSIVNTSLF